MNWLVSEAAAKITIQLSEPVNNPAVIPMKLSPSRRPCGTITDTE